MGRAEIGQLMLVTTTNNLSRNAKTQLERASLTEGDSFRFKSLERTSDGFFLKLSYLLRIQ